MVGSQGLVALVSCRFYLDALKKHHMRGPDIALLAVTAYALAAWLDHVLGTGAYRATVTAASRALCRSFRACDADRNLWLLVALSLGASAFYIALALQLGP